MFGTLLERVPNTQGKFICKNFDSYKHISSFCYNSIVFGVKSTCPSRILRSVLA